MANLNLKTFRDKVLGCWAGKNIGGTLGGPFEWQIGPLDVTFYTHKLDGQPLPNDDLDLQLIWLVGLEQHFCPYELTPQIMGNLWHDFIIGHWNEYGVCKNNIIHGFYPPLSGKINNKKWGWSNGAWIRSEIWACCFPGSPDEAIRSAYLDSCCDHWQEGIYAEMFTAALESAAFVEDDVHKLIDIALLRIPAESRIGRAVRIAREYYQNGKTYLEARAALIEDSKDLGTFQAPCNVAFAVVGLLWGEGDMGRTVCIATNCGDDTDCTAGTAGAVIGIIKGFSGIPKKWLEPIGMSIQTCCITELGNVWPKLPKTIDELTDRVVNIALNTVTYNPKLPKITKDGTGFTQEEKDALMTLLNPCLMPVHPTMAEILWAQSSTELRFERSWAWIYVRYPDDPEIIPGKPFHLEIRFRRCSHRVTDMKVKLRIPEGWSCPDNDKRIMLPVWRYKDTISFDVVAPENTAAFEYLEMEVSRSEFSVPEIITIPLQFKDRYFADFVWTRGGDPIEDCFINAARANRPIDL